MVNVLMVNVLISEWSPPVSKSAVSFFYFVLRFILNKFFNALLSTFIIFFDILWYSLIFFDFFDFFDRSLWSKETMIREIKNFDEWVKENEKHHQRKAFFLNIKEKLPSLMVGGSGQNQHFYNHVIYGRSLIYYNLWIIWNLEFVSVQSTEKR